MKTFVFVLACLIIGCSAPKTEVKSCEDRGLSTRTDGQCYHRADLQKAIERGHKNRSSAPVNTFVNNCGYQTKRLREERERYDNSRRSSHAQLRFLAVLSDYKKACEAN